MTVSTKWSRGRLIYICYFANSQVVMATRINHIALICNALWDGWLAGKLEITPYKEVNLLDLCSMVFSIAAESINIQWLSASLQ